MARQRRARNDAGELLESPWQTQVVQLGGHYGWTSYHTHDSRRSNPGFPDLVMERAPELLFVELKKDYDPDKVTSRRVTIAQAAARSEWLQFRDITTEQAGWLMALARVAAANATIEVHVWRPAMFDDVVHTRLARGRYRQEPVA